MGQRDPRIVRAAGLCVDSDATARVGREGWWIQARVGPPGRGVGQGRNPPKEGSRVRAQATGSRLAAHDRTYCVKPRAHRR